MSTLSAYNRFLAISNERHMHTDADGYPTVIHCDDCCNSLY